MNVEIILFRDFVESSTFISMQKRTKPSVLAITQHTLCALLFLKLQRMEIRLEFIMRVHTISEVTANPLLI